MDTSTQNPLAAALEPGYIPSTLPSAMADSPETPGDDPLRSPKSSWLSQLWMAATRMCGRWVWFRQFGASRSGSPVAVAPASPARKPEKALEVFMSYNSKDNAVVAELADKLSDLDLKPFLDRWDLPIGQPFRPEIEQVLSSCDAVIVALGPYGLGNVQSREIDVALQRQDKDKIPVIPVLLPGSNPPQGFLAQLHWVDLRDRSVSDGARGLADAVRRKPQEPPPSDRARYLRNLLWLLLILIAGAVWCWQHLHPQLAQGTVGGISVIAVLGLIYKYFKWGVPGEVESLPKRLLGGCHSTYWLIGVLIFVVGLLVVTSSVQLRSSGDQSDRGPWTVEVLSKQGATLWKSPEMPPENTASKLFLFRFGEPIWLRLVPEHGHDAIFQTLGPGSRVIARVPNDFPPRTVGVLRVLPGPKLIYLLAQPNETVSQKYELRLRASGTPFSIPDVRRQAVYLAPQLEDIELGLARETEAFRRDQFGEAARRFSLGSETSKTQAIWDQVRQVAGWTPPPPASLAGLSVELIKEGTRQTNQLNKTVLDATTNNIQTILIEKDQ